MPAEERQRIQERMSEWARMTPEERGRARLQFQEARQISPQQRQARWDAYLALPEEERRALATSATKVPQAYLAKVVQELVRGGVLRSQRGIGGGISLVKTPDKITILDVVNAIDPIHRITRCPLEIESHGFHLCPLHRRVDDALAMVEKAFSSTTLGQILTEPGSTTPLCEVRDLGDNRQNLDLKK